MEKQITKAAEALSLGKPASITLIYSGDWARVIRVETNKGKTYAVKCPTEKYVHLSQAEANMLQYLGAKADVPIPKVIGIEDSLLFLSFIENDGHKTNKAEQEAGRHLAALHSIVSDKFGFENDTIFGPCLQSNSESDDWVAFFRDRRILHMTRIAFDAGRINAAMATRLEKLAVRLGEFITSPPKPVLVHGDFWGGNVLYHNGHCAAFIDPAIYYGHPEVDLAFATLFGSFEQTFFSAYEEIQSIEPGFQERIGIYNLWPLLFHAYWFGGGYVNQIDAVLREKGF